MSKKNHIGANDKRRNPIKLETKIEIFERFLQTGEELNGKTVFDGYPVGQWAVQIRNNIKRLESEKCPGKLPPKEQIEKLTNLGILERKKGAKIDEKIDLMADWIKKYPLAKICLNIVRFEVLEQYAKSEEDLEKLKQEYQEMIKYYEYARTRNVYGKLTPDQVLKCKDANIGGVFGYPTYMENLAKEYRT